MRTADRLVGRDWLFPLGLDEHRDYMEFARATVRNSPKLVADNVAHYVDQRGVRFALEDLPSLAPPWPSFWIEYPSTSGRQRRGVLILDTTEYADSPLDETLSEGPEHVPQLSAGAKRHALLANNVDPAAVRWIVTFVLFLEQGRAVYGPVGMFSLALDEGGLVLGNRWSLSPLIAMQAAVGDVRERAEAALEAPKPVEPAVPTVAEMEAMTPAQREELFQSLESHRNSLDGRVQMLNTSIRSLEEAQRVSESVADIGTDTGDHSWLLRALTPAFQALGFLHCKNVVLDSVVPAAKVQAKRLRAGKEPLVRYQTLRLEVPRKMATGGGRAGLGEFSALHIVSGHFSHYGACCPSHPPRGLLFGRHEGVYWVPSHARGDRRAGEVHTDYDLIVAEQVRA
jgi:hypothetical protein